MKVYFFNGPPRSGKDTAVNFADLFFGKTYFSTKMKFAAPLVTAVAALIGVSEDKIEDLKSSPAFPGISDMTVRQLMIHLSEEVMKPRFGIDVFGKIALRSLKEEYGLSSAGIARVLFSDSGFRPEALPIIEWAGPENCHIVRMFRPGCDFKGDSRSYIYLKDLGVKETEIHNIGTLEDLRGFVFNTIKEDL